MNPPPGDGGPVPTGSARRTVAELTRRGLTVATAESLTAGLLAATIADVPGASRVLRGGLIVYATELKTTLAGVDRELIAEYGVVSGEVARALAVGAARRCGADLGIGLTGVAGPGPEGGVAAGTVFLAVQHADGDVRVVESHLEGDRQQVRRTAFSVALETVLGMLGNETRP